MMICITVDLTVPTTVPRQFVKFVLFSSNCYTSIAFNVLSTVMFPKRLTWPILRASVFCVVLIECQLDKKPPGISLRHTGLRDGIHAQTIAVLSSAADHIAMSAPS